MRPALKVVEEQGSGLVDSGIARISSYSFFSGNRSILGGLLAGLSPRKDINPLSHKIKQFLFHNALLYMSFNNPDSRVA